ncbi:MAG: hypothetical protein ACOZF0_05785 [Thermodesulfobacteriota bacterium]
MASKPITNRIPRLPRRSVYYLAFCFAGIMCFLLAGLLPNQRQLEELDAEIGRLNQAIERQTRLYPVFQKALQAMQQKEQRLLPFPEKQGYPVSRLGEMPALFQRIAMESGLAYQEAVPDVSSLKKDTDRLRLHIVVKGDFIRFHDFLRRLGTLSYLEQIESILITAEGDRKEYGLQAWVWIQP